MEENMNIEFVLPEEAKRLIEGVVKQTIAAEMEICSMMLGEDFVNDPEVDPDMVLAVIKQIFIYTAEYSNQLRGGVMGELED